ncbi:FAS1 domain-containing protein [Agrocybe pediades]|nr:FAS1 domain-containing protein [Agrocybe pediades]
MHTRTLALSLSLPLLAIAISLDYGALPNAISLALEPGIKEYIGGQEPIQSVEPPPVASHGGTIYQILSKNPSFSRVTKALNFVEDVAEYLNQTDSQLTFFAPPDEVLRRPHPHKSHGILESRSLEWLNVDAVAADPFTSNDEIAYYLGSANLVDALQLLDEVDVSDDDDKKERRKKILKIIIRALLQYHIVPEAYDIKELGHNTTYPTKLAIPGALDGKPLRLRVAQSLIPQAYFINFFIRVVHSDLKADNGYIHIVNHPLLPPPSAFQELYMAPRFFSTLTSVLQRSGLTEETDLRYVHGEGLKGAATVTVFAPTNRAFQRLPKKLQLFLFSPFGERILRKIVQYHVVPNQAVHSNHIHHSHKDELFVYNSDDFSLFDFEEVGDVKPSVLDWFKGIILGKRGHHLPKPEPVISKDLKLDTLYVNHTLDAHLEQNKIKAPFPGHKDSYIIQTKVLVNHRPAIVSDIVALNGAVHVVDRLLDPRPCKCKHHDNNDGDHHKHKHHHHHHHHHHSHKSGKDHHKKHHKHHDGEEVEDDTWNDWESWLLQWANETD